MIFENVSNNFASKLVCQYVNLNSEDHDVNDYFSWPVVRRCKAFSKFSIAALTSSKLSALPAYLQYF